MGGGKRQQQQQQQPGNSNPTTTTLPARSSSASPVTVAKGHAPNLGIKIVTEEEVKVTPVSLAAKTLQIKCPAIHSLQRNVPVVLTITNFWDFYGDETNEDHVWVLLPVDLCKGEEDRRPKVRQEAPTPADMAKALRATFEVAVPQKSGKKSDSEDEEVLPNRTISQESLSSIFILRKHDPWIKLKRGAQLQLRLYFYRLPSDFDADKRRPQVAREFIFTINLQAVATPEIFASATLPLKSKARQKKVKADPSSELSFTEQSISGQNSHRTPTKRSLLEDVPVVIKKLKTSIESLPKTHFDALLLEGEQKRTKIETTEETINDEETREAALLLSNLNEVGQSKSCSTLDSLKNAAEELISVILHPIKETVDLAARLSLAYKISTLIEALCDSRLEPHSAALRFHLQIRSNLKPEFFFVPIEDVARITEIPTTKLLKDYQQLSEIATPVTKWPNTEIFNLLHDLVDKISIIKSKPKSPTPIYPNNVFSSVSPPTLPLPTRFNSPILAPPNPPVYFAPDLFYAYANNLTFLNTLASIQSPPPPTLRPIPRHFEDHFDIRLPPLKSPLVVD